MRISCITTVVKRLLPVFVFCTITLFTFELAVTSPISLLLPVSAGMALLTLLTFFLDARSSFLKVKRLMPLPACRFFICLLAFYLIWDILGFIIPDGTDRLPMLIDKYKPILLMATVSAAITLSGEGVPWRDKISGLLFCLSVSISILAVGNTWIKLFPILYNFRITLRTDYNMFAVTILAGTTEGLRLCLLNRKARIWKKTAILMGIGINTAAILLSASRRALLMLVPIALFYLIIILWQAARDGIRPFLSVLMSFFMITAGALGGTYAMGKQMEYRYQTEGDVTSAEAGRTDQTRAAQRYETIGEGSMLSKRLILWKIALKEYQTYSIKGMLLGKGSGSSILLYDQIQNTQLDTAYPPEERRGLLSPHSFLLADLLDGGFIKFLLGIGCWVSLAWVVLWISTRENCFFEGAALGIQLATILAGGLISNRFGFLYDKFFWLFAVLTLITAGQTGQLGARPSCHIKK